MVYMFLGSILVIFRFVQTSIRNTIWILINIEFSCLYGNPKSSVGAEDLKETMTKNKSKCWPER